MAAQTPLRTGRLLLTLDTNITCPSCAHEFSLEEGFAKKALERLEDAERTGALAALREAEAGGGRRSGRSSLLARGPGLRRMKPRRSRDS